jgi:lipopolysaccharide export system protein LptA
MNKSFTLPCAALIFALPLVRIHAAREGLSLRPIEPSPVFEEPKSLEGPGSPAAKPAAPAKKTDEEAPKEPTEITCEKEANFDEKTHKAIFIGNVHVKDPQFVVDCDKLTAFLKHETANKTKAGASPDAKAGATPGAKTSGPAGKPAKPSASPPAKAAAKAAPGNAKSETGKGDKADPQAGGAGGLERAIAEGHVTIVQDKPDPDGGPPKHYVGHATKADYDTASGDIVLTGEKDPATWPTLQEGINTHIATEAGVVMTLNRSGTLHTVGKTKTVITEQDDNKKKPETTEKTK